MSQEPEPDVVNAAVLPRIALEESAASPSQRPPMQSDFAVVSLLGEGGMGRVLLARQCSLEREVALKTLRPRADADATGALLREARITGTLEHPGIVPVHLLAFDEAGQPMLVMKRVDGVDLETLLADESHPMWAARGRQVDRLVAALEILVQVCLTLEFAHSRGVVHRDIKPRNIMVGSFGEVYLLDWGIATTMSDAAPGAQGTPAYMAPEIALGRPGDHRTDVYLVGATLHAILTGSPRHRGDTDAAIQRAASVSAPFAYPESVPKELAELCNRATARSPGARPASIEEVREAIRAFIRGRGLRVLNDAATHRLGELETMFAAPGIPQELARAYRLVTEARFGFAQVLREHASDVTAREGMRRCLAFAVELELRQDHVDSAEALLREMEGDDPALAARVDEARERKTVHRREEQRLKLLDRDFDPTQYSWLRGIFLISFWIAGIAIGRFITLGGALTPERIAGGSVVSTVLFCSGLFIIRNRMAIIWNAFNKRLIALVVVSMLMVVTHRLIAVAHRTPVEETMTIDLVIAAGAVVYASYAYVRRLALPAVPIVLGLPLALHWPRHAPFIFVAALATGTPLAALVVMMMQKPGAPPPRTED